MKILIGYPPLESVKGYPLLSGNRQFQWFSHPTIIFPIVPASAATLLKNEGYEVIWKDGIAEHLTKNQFFNYISFIKPDLFAFETKTPVIKQHWKIISELKKNFPGMKIVIFGDHVTAIPSETMKKSKVDFVITGGDYDFSLLELCNYLTRKKEMPKGLWYRENGEIKNNGKFELNHNLNELPFIDRDLCKWKLYEKEYNMKYKPFMYIMSGRDCPWGRCSFCSWPRLYPNFRTRSVENVLDEIGILIKKYKVKEIFNDVGTHPGGVWLREFCNGMIERKYNKKIAYSTNFRFDYVNEEDAKLMKKAGFRLLKMGLESGSQETLVRLNKGINIEQIREGCRILKKAKLTVQLTVMYGYFWEGIEDATKTYLLTKELMENGWADVLQSTIVMPYPSTRLFREVIENNGFIIKPDDWEKFDMTEPVMKGKNMFSESIKKYCDDTYKLFFTPKYVIRTTLKNLWNPKYLFRGAMAAFRHVKDFKK